MEICLFSKIINNKIKKNDITKIEKISFAQHNNKWQIIYVKNSRNCKIIKSDKNF